MNYFRLSAMNRRPPLTSLASFLTICHTVNFLAPWMLVLKMEILITEIHPSIHSHQVSVPGQRSLTSKVINEHASIHLACIHPFVKEGIDSQNPGRYFVNEEKHKQLNVKSSALNAYRDCN